MAAKKHRAPAHMKKPSRPKKATRPKKPSPQRKPHRTNRPQPAKEPNRTFHKIIHLPNVGSLEIRFWADGNRIFVAAFNVAGKRVSAAIYSAEVHIADDLYSALKDPLIESLAKTIESDLLNNPKLHYRP
jgi:hypothetical protein